MTLLKCSPNMCHPLSGKAASGAVLPWRWLESLEVTGVRFKDLWINSPCVEVPRAWRNLNHTVPPPRSENYLRVKLFLTAKFRVFEHLIELFAPLKKSLRAFQPQMWCLQGSIDDTPERANIKMRNESSIDFCSANVTMVESSPCV